MDTLESRVVAPFSRLTSTKVTYLWSGREEAAFENIKKKFQETLSLYIPDWIKPFVIKTDASKIAVGSVLVSLRLTDRSNHWDIILKH